MSSDPYLTFSLEKMLLLISDLSCLCECSTYWKTEDEGGMAGFAGDADTHPYVSFTINTTPSGPH